MKKPSGAKTKLDVTFWKGFAKKNWERSSTVIENVDSPLLQMDEAAIFQLLVTYANRCRKAKDADGFKFYIDGEKLHEFQVLQLLPTSRDRSLRGYHERMQEQFADYCLVCDELLQVNDRKDLLIDFTSGLYAQVGLPNRFAEMGLYLGNYRKTPFGVHVDGCGVFSFPVAGEKTFRIWPNVYDRKNPKKGSFVMSARPGDMAYWPSTAWHIAESDGSFSATWSLGIWVDRAFKLDLSAILADGLASALGALGESGLTPYQTLAARDGEVSDLPQVYLEVIRKIKNLSRDELHEVFLKNWTRHVSKQGLKISSVHAPVLKNGMSIRLKTLNHPIVWATTKNGRLISLSFNGVQTEMVCTAALLKMMRKLNSGETLKVSAAFPHGLRELAAAGAYTVI